jgi:hypothetical protein
MITSSLAARSTVHQTLVVRRDEKGQIIEENLFYDVVGFMKQIGLSK